MSVFEMDARISKLLSERASTRDHPEAHERIRGILIRHGVLPAGPDGLITLDGSPGGHFIDESEEIGALVREVAAEKAKAVRSPPAGARRGLQAPPKSRRRLAVERLEAENELFFSSQAGRKSR